LRIKDAETQKTPDRITRGIKSRKNDLTPNNIEPSFRFHTRTGCHEHLLPPENANIDRISSVASLTKNQY